MNEDFFDRLDRYMIYKKLNDNKVTVESGIPVGSLGKQRKGSRGLSIASIAKLLYTYSDLNADWVRTGRGEMLLSEEKMPEHELINELKIINRNYDEMKKDRDEWFFKARKLEEELKKYNSKSKTDEAV